MNKLAWQERPERGVTFVTRLFLWFNLSANQTFGRFLLYPIAAYFLLFSSATRRASRKYLSLVSGHPATLGQVFRHYLTFSQITLDRAFFLKGRLEEFEVAVNGEAVFEEQFAKGKGCLLLGAHLGSFEVLRALGGVRRGLRIKVLMYPDNSPMVMAMLRQLNPELAQEIIALGRPETMLAAKQHLDSGGVIGLLGDRISKGDKVVRTEVLGQPADLPAGPMMLAAMLKVPVIFFCGLYKGDRRYEVSFELLAERVVIDPSRQEEDLQRIIDGYAARIGHYSRLAPYNWSNFYDFWDSSNSRG